MAILVVIVALMAILVVVLVAIRGDRAVKFASLGGGVALERGRDLVGAAIQDAGVAGPERARRGGARPKGQQKGEKTTVAEFTVFFGNVTKMSGYHFNDFGFHFEVDCWVIFHEKTYFCVRRVFFPIVSGFLRGVGGGGVAHLA